MAKPMRYLAATLALFITVLYPAMAPTPHRIDTHWVTVTDRFERQIETTEADIVAIFGVPPGVYTNWRDESVDRLLWSQKRWLSDRYAFDAKFDARGRLNQVAIQGLSFPESLLKRWLRILRAIGGR